MGDGTLSVFDALFSSLNPLAGAGYELGALGYKAYDAYNGTEGKVDSIGQGLTNLGESVTSGVDDLKDSLPTASEFIGGSIGLGVFIVVCLVLVLLILGKVDAL